MGIEEVLGADADAEILYKAGYKSAWHWCEKEAECHGLEGVAVDHYMKRLSQRGWGLFEIERINLEKAPPRSACGIRLRLRLRQGQSQGRLHVHRLVRRRHGPDPRRPAAARTPWPNRLYSGAEDGHEDGLFVVKPL